MLNIALHTNTIPHTWKLANTIPIQFSTAKQRYKQGYFLLTHITSLSRWKDTGEMHSSIPHQQHYNMGITLHNNNSTCVKRTQLQNCSTKCNHAPAPSRSTRHEQSFRHSQQSHTHRKVTINKHPTHHHQIRCQLYQRTQSLPSIHKPHIHDIF